MFWLQYFILLLKLSIKSNKQTCLLKVLTIHMLFVKHFMSHFEIIWEKVLLVLTHHTTWFISLGWNSFLLIFQEFAFIILFMAWFEILTNSRKGVTFSSLSLPVIIKQTYLFLKNLNVQSSSLCWSRWDSFESDPKICK